MPFSKIKEAILSCDDSVLSEQHLRQMESFAPDDKEVHVCMCVCVCVGHSSINLMYVHVVVPWVCSSL